MYHAYFTAKSETLRRLRALAIFCVLGALALALAGCASDPPYRSEEIVFPKTSFSFDQDRAPFTIFEEYRMAPGDLLDVLYHINTWQSEQTRDFEISIDHTISVKFVNRPELNETQDVRPDGKISLPYLGSVDVVDKSVDELTADLKQRYTSILKDPEIYVTVPQFRRAIREFKEDLHTAPRGLSRLVTVRPDGYATFAMIGDLRVAGRPVPEVSREMNERYAQMIPGMSVDLFLERHTGSVVYVLGEVREPNAYPIVRFTSVLESLALAEGTTPEANLKEVVVVRRTEDTMTAVRLNVEKTLELEEDAQFFYLMPDDIVYVPRRGLSRKADVMREVQQIMMFRGWSISGDYDLGDIWDDDDQ